MSDDRRLIEDYIPIAEISKESAREKSIRKGHISTLHLWWARRPLVAARAAVYASLIRAPETPQKRTALSKAMIDLCKWEADENTINKARKSILEAQRDRLGLPANTPLKEVPPPKVLDMFAGGGAIPLESLRLGCETYAVDLNPVAHIIELCTLVYPQKYGKPLATEVEKWGNWVIEKVRAEIDDLYPEIKIGEDIKPSHEQGELDLGNVVKTKPKQLNFSLSQRLVPVAYLWTRTVKCPNPECGADVPLVRQTWLCKKSKKYVALKISPNYQTKKVEFKVVEATTAKDLGFDPSLGSSRGNSTCHHCGTTINVKQVKEEGKAGRIGHQLMAIVCTTPDAQGKTYLSANDFQQYIPNEEAIKQRLEKLCQDTGLTIPDEPLPDYGVLGFRVQPYGLVKWYQLFTSRQLLSLMTFVKWVRLAYEEMMGDSVMANGDGVMADGDDVMAIDREAISESLNKGDYFVNTRNDDNGVMAIEVKQSQGFLQNEGIASGVGNFTNEELTGNTPRNDGSDVMVNDSETISGIASLPPNDNKNRFLNTPNDNENNTSNNPNDNVAVSKIAMAINSNNHGDNIVKDSIFKTGSWQSEEEKQEFAKAVTTYLGILCDRLTDYNSSLTKWGNSRETVGNTFSRQALPMVWDFTEINPIGNASGNATGALEWITSVLNREGSSKGIIDNLNQSLQTKVKQSPQPSNYQEIASEGIKSNNKESHFLNLSPNNNLINYSKVYRGSSMALPLENKSLDGIVTDPPYFDSVPYADLSDYFYVWFKRSIGHLYPEHFSSQLTPKKKEAIMEPSRHGGDKKKASQAYENMMHQAFCEANRVLKDDGIIVIVYAHKTTSGWTTLIDSLRRAGFMITEAFPLDTEMAARLRGQDSAALASSIFLVVRKRIHAIVGDYAMDVHPQLREIVQERVKTLMNEGVSGADLVIACVGAGLKAYTQYDTVELLNGEELEASTFLDEVQKEVAETILKEVLGCDQKGVSAVNKPTQYYILARYEYGEAVVEFDEANTLVRGVGVELDGIGGLTDGKTALVKKDKNKVQLHNYLDKGKNETLGIRADTLGKQEFNKSSSSGKSAGDEINSSVFADIATETNTKPKKGQKADTSVKRSTSYEPTLIDILHRLLWLAEHKPSEINNYLALAQPDGNKLKLVAQSLAGRALTGNVTPSPIAEGEKRENNESLETINSNVTRSAELRAIDTLLASWKRSKITYSPEEVVKCLNVIATIPFVIAR
ncbi:adenine-specific DNA methylase containing a Zn-ribbon (plasmid) [Geminocystis sp. NIES-3708]|uniref:DUF1156 domain-containing protein n=1 Tax=Geminocystis sp. NIES-3708 TaxID=1615909 RepID=UPI0005FCD750|nr:DUF1156 domain-containing protein [Geminocystis sp. NIES-3708]BAQ63145.1 adenine-specific DNA methylase containing a Zn-ribbon [Geminocystis sp. NIES-3708]